MKYLLLITTIMLHILFASDSNETTPIDDESAIIEVKDTSGLSKSEVRKISNDAVKAPFFQAPWEDMSPTPKSHDWIQTTAGEWFKGSIEAMYKDKLEFDSDEMDHHTFKFKDIAQIKSFNIIGVNIENYAIFSGIIRLKDDKIIITQGDKVFKFNRDEIISLAPEGTRELSYWSGKIDLGVDIRSGNKDQYDFTLQAKIKRRTSMSNLYFNYLGRVSSKDNERTANDHRLDQKYDRYITKKFFWTPLTTEYYQDEFSNIKHQVTVGVGLGYTIIDDGKIEWSISSGPGYRYLEYISVINGNRAITSPALNLSTKLEIELTKRLDFKYDYKSTISNDAAGVYNHHMVTKLETEMTSWLDLDFTLIWDYLLHPKETDDRVMPDKNDYQFIISLGVEF